VWKARDTRLDRIVAIKRLKGNHGARFEQEARAIAALNHPHICRIHDIGPDALRIAAQIASALEAAHTTSVPRRLVFS
jgi:eukaryotic-like serine/threonine-protein kinase